MLTGRKSKNRRTKEPNYWFIWIFGSLILRFFVVLPSQELHDHVDVDRQAEIAGSGKADHRGSQRFSVERDPVGRLVVAVADDCLIQVVDRLFWTDGDHVAGAKLIAGARD